MSEVNVLALCKERERYVLLFDDARRGEALKTIGRWAGNPELDFTWYDAAVLTPRIRGMPQTKQKAILAQRRGDAGEGIEP